LKITTSYFRLQNFMSSKQKAYFVKRICKQLEHVTK